MSLENVLQECAQIVHEEVGMVPQASQIQVLNTDQWKEFCEKKKVESAAGGVYISKDMTAYVRDDTEYLELNAMHELFGHGLFFERARDGITILNLERQYEALNTEVTQEMMARIAQGKELDGLLEILSQVTRPLSEVRKKSVSNNEGFATWIEGRLAERTGRKALFEKKLKEEVHESYGQLYRQFREFEDKYGQMPMLCSLGFPKETNKENVREILKAMFPKEYDSIELGLLYGSRKPYSDIYVFIVSYEIPSQHLGWLDVYSTTPDDLEYSLNRLDISVTDPLLTGELVTGEEDNLRKYWEFIERIKPTQIMVDHNFRQAVQQEDVAKGFPERSKEWMTAMGYAKSYMENAKQLYRGQKRLTMKELGVRR